MDRIYRKIKKDEEIYKVIAEYGREHKEMESFTLEQRYYAKGWKKNWEVAAFKPDKTIENILINSKFKRCRK